MTKIKWRILQILLIAAALFWGLGYYDFFVQKYLVKKNLSNILERYATDMNSECPIAVGGSTELVIGKVYFLKEKTIVYEYEILNISKDSLSDSVIAELKENLIEPLIEEINSIESLAKLRNKDVIFEYIYFDKQREEMFRIRLLFNTPITVID